MKGFQIFIIFIDCSLKEVLINTAALVSFKGENLSSWLQVIYGSFGFGALFGPILIYICELNSLNILGFCALITILFYYMLETPQKMIKEKKYNRSKIVNCISDHTQFILYRLPFYSLWFNNSLTQVGLALMQFYRSSVQSSMQNFIVHFISP